MSGGNLSYYPVDGRKVVAFVLIGQWTWLYQIDKLYLHTRVILFKLLVCTLGCGAFFLFSGTDFIKFKFRWAFNSSGPMDFKTVFILFSRSYIFRIFRLQSSEPAVVRFKK